MKVTRSRDVYVSSSAGSDDATGADSAHAWKTLSRVRNASLAPGDTIHLAGGDKFAEPLIVMTSGMRCTDGHVAMRGFFEGLHVSNGTAVVTGWVVDPTDPIEAVGVRIAIDGVTALETVASCRRPDLVKAGVAPNPEHGLMAELGPAAVSRLHTGNHSIEVFANVSGCSTAYGWTLPPNGQAKQCACDGRPCACPASLPSGKPLRIVGAASGSGKRAVIRLDGTGIGMTVAGFDAVDVEGVEIQNTARGIRARGRYGTGPVKIKDVLFRGVWNRSSIGQSLEHTGRDCTNGWTASIGVSHYRNASV